MEEYKLKSEFYLMSLRKYIKIKVKNQVTTTICTYIFDQLYDFVMDQCYHDEPLNMLLERATRSSKGRPI
jgi:hypothetical protein